MKKKKTETLIKIIKEIPVVIFTFYFGYVLTGICVMISKMSIYHRSTHVFFGVFTIIFGMAVYLKNGSDLRDFFYQKKEDYDDLDMESLHN